MEANVAAMVPRITGAVNLANLKAGHDQNFQGFVASMKLGEPLIALPELTGNLGDAVILIRMASGAAGTAVIYFTYVNGQFMPCFQCNAELAMVAGIWQLKQPDGLITEFNSDGKVVSQKLPNGDTKTYLPQCRPGWCRSGGGSSH